MPVESLDDVRNNPGKKLRRKVIAAISFSRATKGVGKKQERSQKVKPETQIIDYLTRRIENLENINRCLLKQLAAANRHRADKMREYQRGVSVWR